MENETKRCPYCGEEIKANAIKCKHCGEFLETEVNETVETNIENSSSEPSPKSQNNSKSGCLIAFLAFVVLIIIGNLLPDTSNNADNDGGTTETEVVDTTPQRVKGDYSGFGTWAVMTANLGGQAANCLESGVGVSLTEQIENFFGNISENKRPEFYELMKQNPRLKFLVTNPMWAENMTFPDACKADVEFENASPDTVMGYSSGKPYTLENAYCKITYTVSEQGGKYRANVINMFCTPTYGYR